MDFYSDDDSDFEFDEGLKEDMDLLSRSCTSTGTDPDAAVAQACSYLAAPAATAAAAPADGSSDEEEEEDEDLALVRTIRENLHLNKSSPSSPLPSSPRPICVWPPSDTEEDDEDDEETLRAIQRRFSHYHAGESTRDPVPSDSNLEAPGECSRACLCGSFVCEPDGTSRMHDIAW